MRFSQKSEEFSWIDWCGQQGRKQCERVQDEAGGRCREAMSTLLGWYAARHAAANLLVYCCSLVVRSIGLLYLPPTALEEVLPTNSQSPCSPERCWDDTEPAAPATLVPDSANTGRTSALHCGLSLTASWTMSSWMVIGMADDPSQPLTVSSLCFGAYDAPRQCILSMTSRQIIRDVAKTTPPASPILLWWCAAIASWICC